MCLAVRVWPWCACVDERARPHRAHFIRHRMLVLARSHTCSAHDAAYGDDALWSACIVGA